MKKTVNTNKAPLNKADSAEPGLRLDTLLSGSDGQLAQESIQTQKKKSARKSRTKDQQADEENGVVANAENEYGENRSGVGASEDGTSDDDGLPVIALEAGAPSGGFIPVAGLSAEAVAGLPAYAAAPGFFSGLPLWALIGVPLGIAAAVAAGGGGGGGGGRDTKPPAAPTIEADDSDRDNLINASGTAEPGSTVTVTWPDGSTSTTTADPVTGNWAIESPAIQGSGTVSATATDAAGNVSPPAATNYIDTTPPAPPTIEAVDSDGDDKIDASGSALRGSTITVTWPDGSTSTTAADPVTGNWAIESPAIQGSGTVSATATDAAGNESLPGITTYTDITPPTANDINISAITTDTGVSSSDFNTSDQTLIFDGTLINPLSANERVQISLDGGSTWIDASTQPGAGTTWSHDNTGNTLAAGTYNVQARIVDQANNIGATDTQSVVIDTTVPVANGINIASITTDTGSSSSDFNTSDQTLTFDGTLTNPLSANERVQISLDGGVTWIDASTQPGAGTTWSHDNTGNTLTAGTYNVQARIVDQANNIGATDTQSVVIDTTVPVANGINIASITTDTGSSSSDFNTSDQNLVFDGTLTSPLSVNERVQISFDGGSTWIDASTQPGAGTTWSHDNTGNTLTAGTYNVQARIVDQANNIGATDTQSVVIDTTAPAANTINISAITTDTGSSASDFNTSDQNLVFDGTLTSPLSVNERVQISFDGGSTWIDASTQPGAGTTWSHDNTGNTLTAGTYNVQARIVDQANNIGATDTQSVVIDTTAPAANTINIASISDDTGASSSDFITSDQTLVFDGTLTNPLSANERVQISLDGGATWIDASTQPGAGTTWSHDNTTSTMSEGVHDVRARIVDQANNVGATDAQNVTIDMTAPVANGINISAITDDTGNSASDFNTNDQNLVFDGTLTSSLSVNERVQISLDGGSTWVDASTQPGAGTSWSHDNTGNIMSAGVHDVRARIVDQANNVGATDSQNVTIDITPPVQNVLITAISVDSGTTDFITNDQDGLTVSAILSAGLGANDRLEYSRDDGATWVDITASVSGMAVSFFDVALTSSTTIQMRVTDQAGNPGVADSQLVTILGDQPSTTVLITDITNDTGVLGDFTTNDNNGLTVHATLSTGLVAGEKLMYSTDGINFTDITASVSGTSISHVDTSLTSTKTVFMQVENIAASAGVQASQLITIDTTAPTTTVNIASISLDSGVAGDFITNDNDGLIVGATLSSGLLAGEQLMYSTDGITWIDISGSVIGTAVSFTDNTLTTTKTVRMKVIDAAANDGPVASQLVTIDTTAPTTTVNITAISVDSGAADFITNDTDGLTISATLSAGLNPGEVLEYSKDGGATWVDITGSVSGMLVSFFDVALTSSTTIQMRVTDQAGNPGVADSQLVTILGDQPSTTVLITGITNDTGVLGDFTTNDNNGLTVHATLSTGLVAGEKLMYSTDGINFTDITASVSGTSISHIDASLTSTKTVFMQVENIAASAGVQASQLITIDTTAPTTTVSIASISLDSGVAGDFITNDNNGLTIGATLSSGLQPGEKLLYSTDGVNWLDISGSVIGTAVSFTDNTLTSTKTVQMKVIDAAANDGPVASQLVTIDTTAPTTTVNITAISVDSGAADFITNDTDGLTISATLSAGLNPGEVLEYSKDGGATWVDITASVSGTSVSHIDASLTTSTTIRMRVTDAANNAGVADIQAITILGTGPSTTVSITSISLDSGTAGDFITNDNNGLTVGATLSSVLLAGETLQYSTDGGTTWTDITGSVSGTTVSHIDASLTSTKTVQMKVVDAAANSGSTASQLITIDTTAPTTTVSIASISLDSGVAGDFTTNDNDGLVIGATLSAGLAAGETLQYSTDGGATWINITGSVIGTNVSHIDNSLTSTKTVQMKVVDAAANSGSTASQLVTIDTTAPTTTVNITAISLDTGTSSSDFITNDQDGLTISATLSAGLVAGEKLEYSRDGGATWIDITTSVSGTAVSHFDVSLTQSTTIKMRVTDAADNSGAEDAQAVVIDNTAPTQTVSITSISLDSGTAGDFITNDNDGLTINATLSSGLLAGETLQYSTDGGTTWTDITGSVSGTTVSHIDASLTSTKTVQMKVVDAAANSGSTASQLITIDTTAPTTTVSIASISLDSGVAGDFTTNDNDGLVIGATLSAGLAAGETLQYSTDGGATWINITGSVIGTNVSHIDNSLTSTKTVQMKVVDAAANSGSTASQLVTIDTTAPTTTVNITAISLDTGTSSSDFITNDQDGLTISATLSAGLVTGEKLEYSRDGGATWIDITASVSGTSVSHFDVSLTQSTTIKMRVTDAANNSGAEDAQAVVIDNTAPTQTVSINSISVDSGTAGDFITNDNDGLTINATLSSILTAGDKLEYSNDGGLSWSDATGSVTGTAISHVDAALTSTATVQFRVTDLADNHGAFASQLVTIDAVAPTTTITFTSISNDSGVVGDFITNDDDGLTITATLSTGLLLGESLLYSNDNGVTWIDITGLVNGTTVSNTDSSLTSTTTVRMKVVDAAANDGPVAIQLITIANTAPVAANDNQIITNNDTPEAGLFRFFNSIFGRSPLDPMGDPLGGFNFWLNEFYGGQTPEQIAESFLSSTEATDASSNPSGISTLNNQNFVERLYLNALNRSPVGGEEAFWVAQLDAAALISPAALATARAEVAISFSQSADSIALHSDDFFAFVDVYGAGFGGPAYPNIPLPLDLFNSNQDQPITIPVSRLIANDSDADGDALSIVSVGNAINGTAALDGLGNVIFNPTAGFTGPATFEYTITDGVATSTATVQIEIVAGPPTGIVITDTNGIDVGQITVAESAMSTGTDSTSTAETTTGTLTIDALTFNYLTVGGVNFSSVPTGWIAVENGQIRFDSYDVNTGEFAYTYELTSPVNHTANPTGLVNVDIALTTTSNLTTHATLGVHVTDDAPVLVTPLPPLVFVPSAINTNLMITLDLSGSMLWSPTDDLEPNAAGEPSRLALAKQALYDLIGKYDALGDVRIMLVVFNGSASSLNAWVTVDEAKQILAALEAGGATDFNEALIEAMSAFAKLGKLDGTDVQNVSYFLSDGVPTEGGNASFDTATGSTWTNFLDDNRIFSNAIGINASAMNNIAYDGITGTDINATQIASLSDLNATLAATVPLQPLLGNLSGDISGNSTFGGDGGHVQSFTADGVVYTYNPAGNGGAGEVTRSVVNGLFYQFDDLTNTIVFMTSKGSTVTVNMDTGAASFSAPAFVSSDYTEDFAYTTVDTDGDTASSTASIIVSATPTPVEINLVGDFNGNTLTGGTGNDLLQGEAGNDTLNGNGGNDYLVGWSGRDVLNGGDGDDTLVAELYTTSSFFSTTLNGDTGANAINGGNGFDTLILSDSSDTLDFDAFSNSINDIELIDLHHNGAHALLDIFWQDIVTMTDADKDLIILGDSADQVSFKSGNGWSFSGTSIEVISGTSHNFDLWTNSNDAGVLVKVEQAIIG